jgi:hypothetical protein
MPLRLIPFPLLWFRRLSLLPLSLPLLKLKFLPPLLLKLLPPKLRRQQLR